MAKDRGIQALLILGMKCDSLLCLGDVLLPQEYLSRVDCGCWQGWSWILRDRDCQQTQVSDCLCDFWSSLVLLFDVVGNSVHCFLVLGHIFCISDVKGMALQSKYLSDKFLSCRSPISWRPSWVILTFNLGLVSVMISVPAWHGVQLMCTLGTLLRINVVANLSSGDKLVLEIDLVIKE